MQTYTHTCKHASKHTATPTLRVGNDVPSHHFTRCQRCAGSTMCEVSFAKEPYSRLFRKKKLSRMVELHPPPLTESVASPPLKRKCCLHLLHLYFALFLSAPVRLTLDMLKVQVFTKLKRYARHFYEKDQIREHSLWKPR